jgi:AcrR family transcriptional regulator
LVQHLTRWPVKITRQNDLKHQRWGSNSREDNSASGRQKILAAAKSCYRKTGIATTTLGDIAREARITRRTIYRYFDNKKAIIQAVVDDQALDFLSRMEDEAEDKSLAFAEQFERYIVFLVTQGQRAPGYQLMLGGDNRSTSSQYYFNSPANYQLLESLFRPRFEEAQALGTIRTDLHYKDLMAWLGRLVLSYIQVPASDRILRLQISNFVIPALTSSATL